MWQTVRQERGMGCASVSAPSDVQHASRCSPTQDASGLGNGCARAAMQTPSHRSHTAGRRKGRLS
eukprot:8073652-Alexandrium_andersonii.AAC.1